MTTFDIYAEPKAPRTKVQSKTAKKTPAKKTASKAKPAPDYIGTLKPKTQRLVKALRTLYGTP